MNEGTKNGFDLMEELNPDTLSPGTTFGNNSFFDIPLSIDTPEPVTINNDPQVPATKEANAEEVVIPVKEATKATDQETPAGESEEDETLKVITLKDNESYDDWNEFSLIALRRVQSGAWDLDEKESPKDLDAGTLMDLMDAQDAATA